VSHELKTPLTAIRMFAETLLMARSRPETREEYLQTIVNESERLTRLINNVLDFSKIEQGTKIYRMEPQELTEVVESVARVLEYPLLQQGFALKLKLERGIIVLADRDAMQQALLNLLSNAMKYSGDSRAILLTLSASDGEACVSVVDRGCGIPAGEHNKIFQKFYRAEGARHEHIPGTGLGLTIVEHVVAAHGGRVAVTSAPGNGSTFSLILPLHRVDRISGQLDPSLGQAHASHSRH
jgi:signal transduction histidine kinase